MQKDEMAELLKVSSSGGLLSFPAFEIVYDTMDGNIKERINKLKEDYRQAPLPEVLIRKASNVAIGKDLNNFRQRYLGYEDDDEIRETFAHMTAIRTSAVTELRNAGTLEEIQGVQQKFKREFEDERTAKADLKCMIGDLYARVCAFEMLEQHFAHIQKEGRLEELEPDFIKHFHAVLPTQKGMDALGKLRYGVQVDPL